MNAAGARGRSFADINVTPLVDVMLVLLIIFMVAAPLMDQGIEVALPAAATGASSSSRELSITLTKDHLLYFNDELVTLKSLRQQLKALPKQPILIRADRSAYVSKLVELWDLCRDTGFRSVRIATSSD